MAYRPRPLSRLVSVLPLLVALALGAFALGAFAAAPVSAAVDPQWNLAADFRTAPDQANPNPDGFGNAAVWYFMRGSTLAPGPASYTPLANFISDRFHVEGLQGWQGDVVSVDEKDQLPHVSINSRSDNPEPLGIDWPPGTVLTHPLPDQTAVVGWRSAASGRVAVDGSLISRHDCGDGVTWSVDYGSTPIQAGVVPSGGAVTFGDASPLSSLHVDQGDFLYFVIGPGPALDHNCDSTGMDVSITLLCRDKDNNRDGSKDKCRKHCRHKDKTRDGSKDKCRKDCRDKDKTRDGSKDKCRKDCVRRQSCGGRPGASAPRSASWMDPASLGNVLGARVTAMAARPAQSTPKASTADL